MYKKAQSQIITTVLIILLVLAGVVIVWQVVRGTIGEGTENIGSAVDCLKVQLEITKAEVGVNAIEIKRAVGGDALSGVNILVNGTLQTGAGTSSPISALETKTYGLGDALNSGDKVEIAAILVDGTVCDIASSRTAA